MFLSFHLLRYKLLAFLILAEEKLKVWTDKYEKQESVEALLEDFIDFVERQKMFETFDKINTETKKYAEIYKMGGAG